MKWRVIPYYTVLFTRYIDNHIDIDKRGATLDNNEGGGGGR